MPRAPSASVSCGPSPWPRHVVPDDADADAALAIMDDADAAAEEFATVLAEKLEADIPPIAEFDAPEDPQGGDGSL